jgi:hypothetical protein
MANLRAIPVGWNNISTENKYISGTTPECFKLNYDSVHKNHNHSPTNFSDDFCNVNKLIVLHQHIRGISHKIDEFLISLPPDAPQVI